MDAEKWIAGTEGQTKLVILVDVTETKSRQHENESTCDPTPEPLRGMDPAKLGRNIVLQHRRFEVPLVENLKTYVYFFHPLLPSDRAMERADFSPNEVYEGPEHRNDICITTGQLLGYIYTLIKNLSDFQRIGSSQGFL